jgi:hypothetical protein
VSPGAEGKGNPYAALLGYTYSSGTLELRLYRGFAHPFAQVEVRVIHPERRAIVRQAARTPLEGVHGILPR